MRHKRKGRRLGRSSSHRKAMLRNLAASLFLTERDESFYEGQDFNPPQHKGRVITTLQKAKEVKPLVEKCITLAKKAMPHLDAAEEHATSAERNTSEWKSWREGEGWQKWNAAMAPAVTARRRVFSLLRDKEAVEILFDDVAPRFEERMGGYTRVMRLAKPRLGDAGTRAILEFVGVHDRIKQKDQTSQAPVFDNDDSESDNSPVAESAAESSSEPELEATTEASDGSDATEAGESDD